MYKLETGDGRLKDVTIENGVCKDLNAYARVTEINQNVVTIDNATESQFANFTAGEKVLIHVSCTNGTDAELLGKYQIATIELVSENRLTLSDKVFSVDLNYFYVQIISLPQFKNLKLSNATIAPQSFDVFKFTGGVVAFQVFDNFTMENSQIDLTDCGIPTQKKNTYRPLQSQEYEGETDSSRRAGEENFITADRFILNSGDGAAMIFAKNFIADENSRIGNPKTHGRAGCRGAADSPFKPSNVTNIGGSSILIAAENLQIQPENLAKYRSADKTKGKGLARCYIASNTILPDDEKLYAFDILADDSRVQKLGVENFGNGFFGNLLAPSFQLNNFAQVTSVVGNKIYFSDKTLSGYAAIKDGGLVLIRNGDGELKISRVLSCGDNFITVENLPPNPNEIFSVPEFENLSLENYNCNGILAVAVSDTLNLSGDINIFNADNLNCGNSQSWNKCAGIFLLAKKINFAENCRLNAGAMVICNELENFSADILTAAPNFIYTKKFN